MHPFHTQFPLLIIIVILISTLQSSNGRYHSHKPTKHHHSHSYHHDIGIYISLPPVLSPEPDDPDPDPDPPTPSPTPLPSLSHDDNCTPSNSSSYNSSPSNPSSSNSTPSNSSSNNSTTSNYVAPSPSPSNLIAPSSNHNSTNVKSNSGTSNFTPSNSTAPSLLPSNGASTPSNSGSNNSTPSNSVSPSPLPSYDNSTLSNSGSNNSTTTNSGTSNCTPSNSAASSSSPSNSVSPSPSPSPSNSLAPSPSPRYHNSAPCNSGSNNSTPSNSGTSNSTPSNYAAPSPSPTNSVSPSASPSNSVSPSPNSPSNSASLSPSPSNYVAPSPSPRNSVAPSPTQSYHNSAPSNSSSNNSTPSNSSSNNTTPTNSPAPSPLPSYGYSIPSNSSSSNSNTSKSTPSNSGSSSSSPNNSTTGNSSTGNCNSSTPVVFDVRSFGAIGNGSSDDTKALWSAWKAACIVESAVLLVPADGVFMVTSTVFSGPCKPGFVFQIDGVLMPPDGPDCWPEKDSRKQWIVFYRADGMTLKGEGTIEGNGEHWWSLPCKPHRGPNGSTLPGPCESPALIRFFMSNNVTVKGLRIQNSPQFHIKFDGCNGVQISGMSISSPAFSPNTDGIHIENTKSVEIYNSKISNGDDCISIGTGCADVYIENVTCRSGHGISIGSLGERNSRACVSNITVRNAMIQNSDNGVRIKTWQGGMGSVSSINFDSIFMENVRNCITIDQYYCLTKQCTNQTSAVYVSDVSYTNIKGTYDVKSTPVHFACSDTVACTNITMSEVELLPYEGEMMAEPFCWNAYGISETLTIPPIYCLQDGRPQSLQENLVIAC